MADQMEIANMAKFLLRTNEHPNVILVKNVPCDYCSLSYQLGLGFVRAICTIGSVFFFVFFLYTRSHGTRRRDVLDSILSIRGPAGDDDY